MPVSREPQPFCPLLNRRCIGKACAWSVTDYGLNDGAVTCAVPTIAQDGGGTLGIPIVERVRRGQEP